MNSPILALRIFWDRLGKRLAQKKRQGWSGITILILRDTAEEPVRVRINQYVVYFAMLMVVALPLASAGVTILRHVKEERAFEKLEDRKSLLMNVPMILAERKQLLRSARTQVFAFQSQLDNRDDKLFATWMDSLTEEPDRRSPEGIVGLDIEDLQRVRRSAENTLSDGAYHAIRLFWHRISIYHLTPRGRPLLTGIGFISSGFGQRPDPFGNPTGETHTGMDFAAAPKSPIVATSPGVVMQVSKSDRPGYGLFVRIHHGLGYTTLYAHCDSLLVNVGDRVQRGQPIALLGRTGRATGHHVHYEVRFGDDKAIDPLE
ncbi:MAG TPA: M23 family metallopeptidase, partial [Leptospiraceae bacterium]|nr:M23 family metallopeptidase [Leptospiraceae bacterium]